MKPKPTEEAKQRAENYMSLKGALEPKQTTIDFIISLLKKQIIKSAHNELGATLRTAEYRIGLTKAIHFCEEAREMFEKQIIDAHLTGLIDSIIMKNFKGLSVDEIKVEITKQAEEYYNETYKQQTP